MFLRPKTVSHVDDPGQRNVSLRKSQAANYSLKEVIQPQVPLRLPCYDFTPVAIHTIGICPPEGLAQ